MANKQKLTTKKEAEEVIRRKEIIKRINERMDASDDIEVRSSKDGKKFYQAAFEKAFDVNKTTVSFYYTYKTDIPMELLCKISERTNCSIQYLCLESDAINYEFDTVIQKTGLSESAIKKLVDKKEYDEIRERDYQRRREYHRRQELEADSPSDVIFMDGARPIKTADVGIIKTMEKMVDDQTAVFTNLDDVATDEKQAELLRRNESAMQKNDYTAFLVTTYIKNILLDFVNKRAEEGRTEK